MSDLNVSVGKTQAVVDNKKAVNTEKEPALIRFLKAAGWWPRA